MTIATWILFGASGGFFVALFWVLFSEKNIRPR